MLVVGGGIIGLEMGTVYAALGTAIDVVELQNSLIPACDPDLVRPLKRRLEQRFGSIMLETKVTDIKAQKKWTESPVRREERTGQGADL